MEHHGPADFSGVAAELEKHYGQREVTRAADGHLVVISDLHLAGGLDDTGNFDGTENFLDDFSFARFLDHVHAEAQGAPYQLVINGDFIDFLRIMDCPKKDDEIDTWREVLSELGGHWTNPELRATISTREEKFGLRTNDFKSVWKLHVCMTGHGVFFRRLAQWLAEGHSLCIVKGNHDLEWHWPLVRAALCAGLAKEISRASGMPAEQAMQNTVLPRIFFVADTWVIDNCIHIEHGHRYQNVTKEQERPVLKGGKELSLTFGSFFNRYLINRIELAYPFIDNVRPAQNILPLLLRERFPLGIKLLFRHIPLCLRLIPKKLWWQTTKYLVTFLVIVVLPLALAGWVIYSHVKIDPSPPENRGVIIGWVFTTLKSGGMLFLSYLIGRVLAMVQLSGPPRYKKKAEEIKKAHRARVFIIMGHTHDPEQERIEDDGWYFNTGTWTPVFEASSASIRHDRTYTFLHIRRDGEGWEPGELMRWNDDALRVDPMRLTRRN